MKLFQIFKNSLPLIGIVSLLMISCDSDDLTGEAKQQATMPNVTISPNPASFAMIEQDTVIEITITLSEKQIVDIPFNFTAVEGEEESDFEVESITIEKGQTQAVGSITLHNNPIPQGSHAVKMAIGDDVATNANYTVQEFTWNLKDYDASISWADCDTDIDLYLYLGNTFIDGSFTVACEEPVNMENLADGVYDLYAEYWAGNDDVVHPVTVKFSNNNGEVYTYTQPEEDAVSVNNSFVYVGTVEIVNGAYTAFDPDGNSLGAM